MDFMGFSAGRGLRKREPPAKHLAEPQQDSITSAPQICPVRLTPKKPGVDEGWEERKNTRIKPAAVAHQLASDHRKGSHWALGSRTQSRTGRPTAVPELT